MPPGFFSILDKIQYCYTSECIEKVVNEYLFSLIKESGSSNNIKLFNDDDSVTENEFFNYYKFSEALLEKAIENDIDLSIIINDLEGKLGKTHPIVVLLKQFLIEE
ncbi:hypothetical protein [Sulfurisphaera ohwakuensis]|uniref:Uncharacterized protein n=1 Tax=Sulfurisphaera ohwakuensis TaxID=69656 RepID=A0A650CIR8_SULOH|nr:hypothetical protein [Sulfurisphaera ohwakuensis]MBB5253389.1 hypothetical protein [Sulfurisphaera ohwakuensis]QGR17710.1 hypothetical protein D1869_11370 [Sulfurisphaera ohwakuensis]